MQHFFKAWMSPLRPSCYTIWATEQAARTKQNAFGTNPRLSLRWTTEFWRSEVGETNSNFIQTRDRTLCQKAVFKHSTTDSQLFSKRALASSTPMHCTGCSCVVLVTIAWDTRKPDRLRHACIVASLSVNYRIGKYLSECYILPVTLQYLSLSNKFNILPITLQCVSCSRSGGVWSPWFRS